MNDKTLKFKIESEGLEKIREATKEIKNDLEEINKCFKNRCEYEVVTKEQFIKEFICSNEYFPNNIVEERWNKISKGFNFVIRAGKHLYDVECFNNKILGI
ncbi:hypothetical protein [Clostridium sp. B9]|uniref:hypothetical protein n=1 Tax=Clostridium sp. B9 TaxID=3423224 RepID=UPI003D2F4F71